MSTVSLSPGIECKFCGTTWSTELGIAKHQRTHKFCIDKQQGQPRDFTPSQEIKKLKAEIADLNRTIELQNLEFIKSRLEKQAKIESLETEIVKLKVDTARPARVWLDI